MNITTGTNSKSLTLLTISQVADKIKLKDYDAAKKWLENKKITIHKDTKTHVVFELDVDCEIDKNWVRDLKIKQPNNWQSLYRKVARDESVYEMVVVSLSNEIITKPIAKIKLTNEEDINLYKQLTA